MFDLFFGILLFVKDMFIDIYNLVCILLIYIRLYMLVNVFLISDSVLEDRLNVVR